MTENFHVPYVTKSNLCCVIQKYIIHINKQEHVEISDLPRNTRYTKYFQRTYLYSSSSCAELPERSTLFGLPHVCVH